MSRFQQVGYRCPNCLDDLYSNARHDLTSCSCGWFEVDGGFDAGTITGVGFQFTEPIPISREVDRRTLPLRYRSEVPA